MKARDPNVATAQFTEGLFDPRVPPRLEPLMQRISRLLGLPLQPPPVPTAAPVPPAMTGALVPASVPPVVPPFASLSQIVATVADEFLDITSHPSPFDSDYLGKLALFETIAWREAAAEFRQRMLTTKNPAGRLPISVLLVNSAARGVLALMRDTKTRSRTDANTNPTSYAMLADYRAGLLGGRHSAKALLMGGTSPQSHSRSRSPDSEPAALVVANPAKRSSLIHAGSRVESTLGFAADDSAFWYTSPETRKRVSPVYDYATLERIAGRSRDQLDFPVLLSTMPPHKRMSLCAHSHLYHHRTIDSSAHQPPFTNFLDLHGPAAFS
ncbi:hypothetical protein AB1Y20_007117 [Prymnesium parvum]|uniref:Uncharacterized protein n=1 Tax=Prymnesium parvum TaxID=97485 RepID=A0AB34J0E9_PRYPA